MALDLFDGGKWGAGPSARPARRPPLAGGLDFAYAAPTAMRRCGPQPEAQRVPWPSRPGRRPRSMRSRRASGRPPASQAVVKNTGKRPVLGGPVNIFVGTDFIGQGRLETTGPGGELTLPLGADEDLRVTRKVIAHTVTEGVFSKEEVTTYRTAIEVANDKRRPVQVRVLDQVPISNDQTSRSPWAP
ncbi:MAG: DUF4139 domain-containing protein [bacterium]